MDSRIVVEIDDKLKKEAQMEAIKNDTTLKEIVTAALENYLHPKIEIWNNKDVLKELNKVVNNI